MKYKDLLIFLNEKLGEENVKINESMKKHTTMRVGGLADYLVFPQNKEQIASIIKGCNETNVPWVVIGNGSNLIVRDKGIRGVVIKLFRNFEKVTVCDETIEADAGILLSRISKLALENGLAGLEFAAGIPGTLGGAVTMNAGAYDGEMRNAVYKTEYIDKEGFFRVLTGDQNQFGYRTSLIQKEGGILLSASLKLKKGNRDEIKKKTQELNRMRSDKQPLEMPSAGSVFKRPEGYYAGKLIEDCGLRGYSIGDAQVSEKHCGFIVNKGEATAKEIEQLIAYIRDKVMDQYQVELQTEVKIIGEE